MTTERPKKRRRDYRDDDISTLVVDGAVATARFSQHAADGNGAWIVSAHAARLFTRTQAITALALVGSLDGRGSLDLLTPEGWTSPRTPGQRPSAIMKGACSRA
jgi:hypothetical protein